MSQIAIIKCYCCDQVWDGTEVYHAVPSHMRVVLSPSLALTHICDCCIDETDWELTTEIGLWAWMLKQKLRLDDYNARAATR